jgi:hypothetical protein
MKIDQKVKTVVIFYGLDSRLTTHSRKISLSLSLSLAFSLELYLLLFCSLVHLSPPFSFSLSCIFGYVIKKYAFLT